MGDTLPTSHINKGLRKKACQHQSVTPCQYLLLVRAPHPLHLHHKFSGFGHLTRIFFYFFEIHSDACSLSDYNTGEVYEVQSQYTYALKHKIIDFSGSHPNFISTLCIHVHRSIMCSCPSMIIYQLSITKRTHTLHTAPCKSHLSPEIYDSSFQGR